MKGNAHIFLIIKYFNEPIELRVAKITKVELLTAPWAAPGTIIQIEGAEYTGEKSAKIDIDHF